MTDPIVVHPATQNSFLFMAWHHDWMPEKCRFRDARFPANVRQIVARREAMGKSTRKSPLRSSMGQGILPSTCAANRPRHAITRMGFFGNQRARFRVL
jgi:hypothetical protein